MLLTRGKLYSIESSRDSVFFSFLLDYSLGCCLVPMVKASLLVKFSSCSAVALA